MKPTNIAKLVITGFIALVILLSSSKIVETVDAGTIVVKAGAFDGRLTVWNEPALYGQWWGHLTRYKRSETYYFGAKAKDSEDGGPAVQVRYNDNGHADYYGTVRYDLPTDDATVKKLHGSYGSQESVEAKLISPWVINVLSQTGPLMSSTESASTRRADFQALAEDQLRYGVYRQIRHDVRETDPLTNQPRTVVKVDLIPCPAKDQPMGPMCIGGYERQVRSPLDEYGVRPHALAFSNIAYDATVKKQLDSQQEAMAAIQTAVAHSRQAEQDAKTAEQRGLAKVAEAKAIAEVEREKAVVAAQQAKDVAVMEATKEKEVAELDAKAAAAEKTANILRGEGEAARARAKMAANGALEQKLEAYKFGIEKMAEALGKQKLVPDTVIGATGGQGANGAANLNAIMSMMTASMAHQLGLNLSGGK